MSPLSGSGLPVKPAKKETREKQKESSFLETKRVKDSRQVIDLGKLFSLGFALRNEQGTCAGLDPGIFPLKKDPEVITPVLGLS